MVICSEQGADLHMAQLMPLPLTVSSSVKSTFVLFFWYRLTRVVPDKGLLNRCVCVCLIMLLLYFSEPLGMQAGIFWCLFIPSQDKLGLVWQEGQGGASFPILVTERWARS